MYRTLLILAILLSVALACKNSRGTPPVTDAGNNSAAANAANSGYEGDKSREGDKSGDGGQGASRTGDSRTIAGGALNDRAIEMPQPPYPPAARAVHASGTVVVNVEVGTGGNVLKAEAVSGHPLLKAAAVAAARAAKFKPGPAPISGSLQYEFTSQ